MTWHSVLFFFLYLYIYFYFFTESAISITAEKFIVFDKTSKISNLITEISQKQIQTTPLVHRKNANYPFRTSTCANKVTKPIVRQVSVYLFSIACILRAFRKNTKCSYKSITPRLLLLNSDQFSK